MFDLPILKSKILSFKRDYKINYFILNNIFWYDNFFRIKKQKKYNDFILFFCNNLKYQTEIIACLFYLQLKFIEKKLFISFDLNLMTIKVKMNQVIIYIDPKIKIINLNNQQRNHLLKIYRLKKKNNINEIFKFDKFIIYNTLFLLKLKEYIKVEDNYIKIFCYDNLLG